MTTPNGTAAVFGALALSASILTAGGVARAGDLQVTLDKKRAEVVGAKPTNEGDAAKSKEVWHYLVNVRNSGLKSLPALDVKYVIFIERQQLGEKIGKEVIDRVSDSAKVGPIEAGKTLSFETKDFQLKEAGLVGNYYYVNGGRLKAKDSIKGVWIKFFDGTKEVDQYVNPSTITSKQKWQ